MLTDPPLSEILIRLIVVVALSLAVGWVLRQRKRPSSTPRYPEWIYGLEDTFRYRMSIAGWVGAVLAILAGSTMLLEQADEPGVFMLSMGIAGTLILGLHVYQATGRRRAREQTYDHGTEVVAEILEASESTLNPTPGMGHTQLGDQLVVARGTSLILRGAWTMRIRFELEGRRVESRRNVSSRTFYRFRRHHQMPILVRPEAPHAWIPVAGGLRTPSGEYRV